MVILLINIFILPVVLLLDSFEMKARGYADSPGNILFKQRVIALAVICHAQDNLESFVFLRILNSWYDDLTNNFVS